MANSKTAQGFVYGRYAAANSPLLHNKTWYEHDKKYITDPVRRQNLRVILISAKLSAKRKIYICMFLHFTYR